MGSFEIAGGRRSGRRANWGRGMAAGVLAEGEVAVEEGSFDGREAGDGEIFFPRSL